MPGYSKQAGGDIRAARFVKLEAANSGVALECDAGDVPFGVSQRGSRSAPWDEFSDDGLAARAGDAVGVTADLGQTALLEYGADVVPGDLLKPDADGKGVPAAADGDAYGALALKPGADGDQVTVQVERGRHYVSA